MQIIICCIICVFGMMILGVPLITAFLGGSIIPLALFSSMPIDVITNKMFASINSFSFLAVPFFMICGGLMDKGGIAKRLVDLAKSLVGCRAVWRYARLWQARFSVRSPDRQLRPLLRSAALCCP